MNIIVEEISQEALSEFNLDYLLKAKKELEDKERILSINIAKIEKGIFNKRKEQFNESLPLSKEKVGVTASV